MTKHPEVKPEPENSDVQADSSMIFLGIFLRIGFLCVLLLLLLLCITTTTTYVQWCLMVANDVIIAYHESLY